MDQKKFISSESSKVMSPSHADVRMTSDISNYTVMHSNGHKNLNSKFQILKILILGIRIY